MLLTPIFSDLGLRERAPRDRPRRYITWAYIKKYGGTPDCRACAVDGPSSSTECRERFEAIFRKEDEEKAMKEAADAAATSAALHDEAATSSRNPPTTTMAGADPMQVEPPKDEVAPTTITGGAASSSAGPVSMEQFDVEITEVTPKRSELEEMPESRKVRKINCVPLKLWVQHRRTTTSLGRLMMNSSGRLRRSRMQCTLTRASR